MRTSFTFHKESLFTSIAAKTFLLTVLTLFCFTGSLFAGVKPAVKSHSGGKVVLSKTRIYKPVLAADEKPGLPGLNPAATVGLPIVNYTGPQTYIAGAAITPLSPTSSGVAAALYGSGGTTVASGISDPLGIAVDNQGNIFFTKYNSNQVYKIPGGTGTPITIGTGFNGPSGIATDAAGNVYVSNKVNNTINEIPADGSPVVTLGSGFSQPAGMAVDAIGNIYVADFGNHAIKKIPAGGGPVINLSSSFQDPSGIAVDTYGNVYVANNNTTISEILSNGTVVTLGSHVSDPRGVAVDATGNIFVAGSDGGSIVKIPAGNGTQVYLGNTSNIVAVDNANNLYIAGTANNLIKMHPGGGFYISPALPSGLRFNNTTGVISGTPIAASPATTYTITAYNQYGSNFNTVNITVKALTMSYTGPQTYTTGTAITALSPTGSGAAAAGYSSSTTGLGSGFNLPMGVAVDASGNVYVADQGNNVVKKIPGGTGVPVIIGTGFNTPKGIAIDAAGNLYVADEGNNAVKKISAGGGAIVTLGSGFSQPYDVCVDTKGNVYVADRGNNAIKEIPVSGGLVTTLGSGFLTPTGVTVDAAGNVYLADNGHNAVKEILTNGTISTLGSGFNAPTTVAVDGTGNVFVADNGNMAVKKISVAPVGIGNGPGTPVSIGNGFTSAFGVATDNANNVYITDYTANAVKKIVPTGGYYISPALPKGLSFDNSAGLISGTPTMVSPATNYTVIAYNQYGSYSGTVNITVNAVTVGYAGPQTYLVNNAITPLSPTGGSAAAPAYGANNPTLGSGFHLPVGVAVDVQGNVYIGDQGNNAVKELISGAGAPVTLGSGFNTPKGVAVDAAGNVYIADEGHNAVKEILTNGTVNTIGSGFLQPYGVAVDIHGNVYVADHGNNAIKEIPVGNGAVITLGSGFSAPTGVAVDAYGNVYIADNGNDAVKEIPAGNGTPVTLGSGFTSPYTLAVDGTGNVFVADNVNNTIKRIPAGNGTPVTVASGFSLLVGVAVDNSNNLYITADGSSVVKKIAPIGGYYINPALPKGLSFNNATGAISGTPTAGPSEAEYTVTAYDAYGGNTASIDITVNTATSNAALSSLGAQSGPQFGPLSPVFASGTTNYTLSVANGAPTITVQPVSADAHAVIKVNGIAVASGGTSPAMALAEGTTTAINIVVTAPDGITTKTYKLTVSRPVSTNAGLSNIQLSSGALSPAFATSTANYTVSVPNSTSVMGVIPTSLDPNATIQVNGTTVASGTSSALIALSEVTTTIINVAIRAQDGATLQAYAISVTRAPSSNADLSIIGPLYGPLTPAFTPGNTSYTLAVKNSITVMAVEPSSSDPNATIKVNGTTVASGTGSPLINLNVGANTISVVVTSQDGTTTKTYTITVTRAAATADLSNIQFSSGTLNPVFAAGTTNYTVSVPNSVSAITVTPTEAIANETISVNGSTVTSGTASPLIELSVNTITNINVSVKAQDGSTQNYIIAVTRAKSSNADLASIGPMHGPLTPTFTSGNTSYTLNVSNSITTMAVEPVTSDPGATLEVNGVKDVSGRSSQIIQLNVGANTIATVVTAQDGITTKTYTITITRASGGADSFDPGISVSKPIETPGLAEDGIVVHQGISPNGDGINDFLQIDNISQYPDNKLMIMNRNGLMIYEAKGYDNSAKLFDGHSNKNGQMQLPGTYFYQLDYTVKGAVKHKTGYVVLKY